MSGITISLGDSFAPLREKKGKSLLTFPDNYVVVGIETTGLDHCFDEIIELAAIKYEDNKEIDRFQSLVKPENGISDFITNLTGITESMLAVSPSISSVLPEFRKFIGDSVIIGHNVNFKVRFIYDFSLRQALPPFINDFIDTMRLSKHLYREMPNYRLTTLLSYLGIPGTVKHRALDDIIVTQQCYLEMKQYVQENGIILTESSKKQKQKLKAKSIVAETNEFNPDSLIHGKSFAFTGKLERMTRREAMQAVVNAGGICCDGVIASTNYLVLGNNDYCRTIKDGKSLKQKKAEKMQLDGLDILTISENVFYDMLMEENTELSGFEAPEQNEFQYLNSILTDMSQSISNHGGDPALLAYRATKSDGKSASSGYTTVSFGTFTVFRIHLRGNQHYLSIPVTFSDLIPPHFPQKQAPSEQKYIRLPVDSEHDISVYTDFLCAIAGETVNRYPKEWSCCSRYMECSNAKHCVHPDKMFALGCGYRKILNSGRIFYGNNRNID